MKKTYIHLVSDSTGDTLSTIVRTVISKFEDVSYRQYVWSLIKTRRQLNRVMEVIKKRPGIVLYTLSDASYIEELKELSKQADVPCIDPLKEITNQFSEHLKETPSTGTGKQHAIDDEYFKRIEAINFTISHDDGQLSDNLSDADIILIGPSRTSKSPTSMYLAYKGFKTANIPYVSGTTILFDPKEIKDKFVVGLSICSSRLVEIRKNRLLSLSEQHHTEYVDTEKVEGEMLESRKFCSKNNWPVIDITSKSIEETAARIVQMYHSWRKHNKSS